MGNGRVPIPGSELQSRVGERALPEAPSSQTLTASVLLRRHAGSAASAKDLLSGEYKAPSREAAAAAIAADPQDITSVRAFLEQYGLKVLAENADARRIQVEGTLQQMEKAFGVQIKWATDAEGHRYLTYSGPITVPESLAGVVTAVLGLDQRPAAKHHS